MGCPLSVPWDEASPSGATTPADTLDTELQNLKISIRERLEDLIPGWSDDAICPKVLDPDIIKTSLETRWINFDADAGTTLNDRDVPLAVYLTVHGTSDGFGLIKMDLSKLGTPGDFNGAEWSVQTVFNPFENLEIEKIGETGDIVDFLLADSTGVTLTSFGPTFMYVTLVKKSPVGVP